jgi:hypothetical protein
MKKVISKDGTPIAYDQLGKGPAVIVVAGALGVRSHPMVDELARLLAPHFTVISTIARAGATVGTRHRTRSNARWRISKR